MIAIAIAGSGVTACSDASGTLGGPELTAAQKDVYHLKPGDKLKIAVFNEPDLTGEFQVSDGGAIAFPLTGDIKAAGLSIDAFRNSLVNRLKQGFVRNPRVTIDFVNYRPINVIGEVKNAGQYAYRPGLTIQDAIAMAGGYSYRANASTFYLRRSDAKEEISLKTDSAKISILPGDNIRVPERFF